MVDIDKLKPLIVERLKPLNPDRIILFGSYAYGTPNEDSDIDLFLLRDDLKVENIKSYKLELQKNFLVFKKNIYWVLIFLWIVRLEWKIEFQL